MPRTVSAALQAELDKTITRLGYFISLSTSPVLQMSNVGTQSWNSKVWVDYSFEVTGIGNAGEVQLRIQNLDNLAAATFMTADMSQVTCDVWQFAPAALAVGDVAKLGRFMLGDMDIGLAEIRVRLIPEATIDAYSPRRRVDPANGFYYALPEGSRIAWENEIYIPGGERG